MSIVIVGAGPNLGLAIGRRFGREGLAVGLVARNQDKLDRLVGIFGSNEGIRNEPDGVFLPPPKPRCYELMIKQAADKLRITCIASRLSILTQPLNGRAPCHYCGQCGRGCATHSNFSSPSVLIPPAACVACSGSIFSPSRVYSAASGSPLPCSRAAPSCGQATRTAGAIDFMRAAWLSGVPPVILKQSAM